MQRKNRWIAVCCMVCFTLTLFAQPKGNSPYSRLGLGDIVNSLSATQLAMGGLTAAYHDAYHSNVANPASYGYLRSTSFQLGVNARRGTLSTDGNDDLDVWNGNLNYMYLGFPMRNPLNEVLDKIDHDLFWSMGFSIAPYTQVGYNVFSIESIAEVDSIGFTYNGEGGTYKLLWGNSVRYKRLSAGVNLGYLFGRIINRREVEFLSVASVGAFQNDFNDEIRVNGFIWNAGIQYDYVFKKRDKKGEMVPTGTVISAGVYGNNSTSFNTTTTQLNLRKQVLSRFFEVVDTLTNVTDIEGEGMLPSEIGFGVTFRKPYHYSIGVDYKAQGWGKYENSAKPENLMDSYKVSIGGEYIPDFDSYNSYLKKVRYRAGAFYSTDPRSDGRRADLNEQLTDRGITFGFGLPIILKQQASFVNLAFEIGKFGSDVSQIDETYYKATVGFTLNNNQWFYKRKFN